MLKPAKFNYQHLLSELKEKIRIARVKAISTVNAQLLAVYWEIGRIILEQQQSEGWGTKIIDRLAADLKIEFPDSKGFSVRNLKYMRTFAEAYPDFIKIPVSSPEPGKRKAGNGKTAIVQAPLAQLSWYHHVAILEKVKV
jgi:hypothetical protein